MGIIATQINYYQICHRKLWLFSNGIIMEQNSDIVKEGKLIGENTYDQRPTKYVELQIENIKIDFYDPKLKIIHEIKKSNKVEEAHIAQVKYYIYKLEQNGILGASGMIEYPLLRKTHPVELNEGDKIEIQSWEKDILRIAESEKMPTPIHKPFCKRCSYFEFCYV